MECAYAAHHRARFFRPKHRPRLLVAAAMSSKSSPRAANSMSLSDYEEAIKVHVETWSNAFQSSETQNVLQQYLPLLCSIAGQTARVNRSDLARAARQVHPLVSDVESAKFAHSLQNVFSITWRKLQTVTSGKHQSPETAALLAIMRLQKKKEGGDRHPEEAVVALTGSPRLPSATASGSASSDGPPTC